MSTLFKRGPAKIEANLTPMIDVTFLLIVFFVLVSQIVEVENVPMDLPRPEDPATQRPGEEQRAVINLIPGAGGRIEGYRLGTTTLPAGEQGLSRLREQLRAMYASSPRIDVNLRADRSTHYRFVEPVMQAVAQASPEGGSARVNLVVVRED